MKKKNLVIVLIVASFAVAGFLPSAHALIFTDTLLFNGGVGTQLDDNNSNNNQAAITPFNFWTHDINDNIAPDLIGGVTLSDATLLVTYSDITGSTTGELWNLIGIGNLLNAQVSTSFPFGASLLADLQADGLFTVNIVELSTGTDRFVLKTSVLSGNYTVNDGGRNGGGNEIPEPAMLSLLGLGLSGLGLCRRFKKS